jgi:hypothetical protein
MLWNQTKLLQGVSLQGTYLIPHHGIAGLPLNLAVGDILLPLRTMLLIGSLIRLPGGTILSHVAWQSTLETCTKILTSLRGGIILVLAAGREICCTFCLGCCTTGRAACCWGQNTGYLECCIWMLGRSTENWKRWF